MTTTYPDVPTLVRERCRELGITIAECARRMNRSDTVLGDYLSGRRGMTTPELLDDVARALSVDRDEVYAAAGVVPPDLAAMIVSSSDRIKIIRGVMQEV